MHRRHRNNHAVAVALTALLAALTVTGCGRGEDRAPAASSLHTPGQWLVVNYWAEWCKPCLEEIPELTEFAGLHAPRVRVVLVNFDGLDGESLQQQAASLGIAPGLLAPDPAAEFGLQRPQALPSTFVIDPEGKLKQVLLGPQTVASLEAATADGASP